MKRLMKPNTMTHLKSRFPYMFSNPGIGMSAGWFPIFEKLCQDIDQILGEDKLGFHWTRTKEKHGGACFYCEVDIHKPGSGASPDDLARYQEQKKRWDRAFELVYAAEEKTLEVCMVCGEPGEMDRSQHYVLTLCEHHQLTRNEWRIKGGWWIYPKKEWP